MQLDIANRNLARQRELWGQQLTTARSARGSSQNDVRAAESSLREREKNVTSQSARINQERATLESARYDLSKVRIESPIDGMVTRRNIQEGETAVIGTMNNAGTVLLTLADMSVIQAEVEVDETNIPHVQLGSEGRRSPSTRCREPRPSRARRPKLATAQSRRHEREFDEHEPGDQLQGRRTSSTNRSRMCAPALRARADITTATTNRTAPRCPFQAVAVRELIATANNQVVKPPRGRSKARQAFRRRPHRRTGGTPEARSRKETEGVFVVQQRHGRVRHAGQDWAFQVTVTSKCWAASRRRR